MNNKNFLKNKSRRHVPSEYEKSLLSFLDRAPNSQVIRDSQAQEEIRKFQKEAGRFPLSIEPSIASSVPLNKIIMGRAGPHSSATEMDLEDQNVCHEEEDPSYPEETKANDEPFQDDIEESNHVESKKNFVVTKMSDASSSNINLVSSLLDYTIPCRQPPHESGQDENEDPDAMLDLSKPSCSNYGDDSMLLAHQETTEVPHPTGVGRLKKRPSEFLSDHESSEYYAEPDDGGSQLVKRRVEAKLSNYAFAGAHAIAASPYAKLYERQSYKLLLKDSHLKKIVFPPLGISAREVQTMIAPYGLFEGACSPPLTKDGYFEYLNPMTLMFTFHIGLENEALYAVFPNVAKSFLFDNIISYARTAAVEYESCRRLFIQRMNNFSHQPTHPLRTFVQELLGEDYDAYIEFLASPICASLGNTKGLLDQIIDTTQVDVLHQLASTSLWNLVTNHHFLMWGQEVSDQSKEGKDIPYHFHLVLTLPEPLKGHFMKVVRSEGNGPFHLKIQNFYSRLMQWKFEFSVLLFKFLYVNSAYIKSVTYFNLDLQVHCFWDAYLNYLICPHKPKGLIDLHYRLHHSFEDKKVTCFSPQPPYSLLIRDYFTFLKERNFQFNPQTYNHSASPGSSRPNSPIRNYNSQPTATNNQIDFHNNNNNNNNNHIANLQPIKYPSPPSPSHSSSSGGSGENNNNNNKNTPLGVRKRKKIVKPKTPSSTKTAKEQDEEKLLIDHILDQILHGHINLKDVHVMVKKREIDSSLYIKNLDKFKTAFAESTNMVPTLSRLEKLRLFFEKYDDQFHPRNFANKVSKPYCTSEVFDAFMENEDEDHYGFYQSFNVTQEFPKVCKSKELFDQVVKVIYDWLHSKSYSWLIDFALSRLTLENSNCEKPGQVFINGAASASKSTFIKTIFAYPFCDIGDQTRNPGIIELTLNEKQGLPPGSCMRPSLVVFDEVSIPDSQMMAVSTLYAMLSGVALKKVEVKHSYADLYCNCTFWISNFELDSISHPNIDRAALSSRFIKVDYLYPGSHFPLCLNSASIPSFMKKKLLNSQNILKFDLPHRFALSEAAYMFWFVLMRVLNEKWETISDIDRDIVCPLKTPFGLPIKWELWRARVPGYKYLHLLKYYNSDTQIVRLPQGLVTIEPIVTEVHNISIEKEADDEVIDEIVKSKESLVNDAEEE